MGRTGVLALLSPEMGPQTNHPTFVNLSFLILKMGLFVSTLKRWARDLNTHEILFQNTEIKAGKI